MWPLGERPASLISGLVVTCGEYFNKLLGGAAAEAIRTSRMAGEISLALEVGADVLLIDERAGRHEPE